MSLRWPTATFCELGPPSRWRRFFFFDILQGYKCSSAEMHALRRLVVWCAAAIRSLPDTAPLRSISTWLLSF